MDRLTIEALIVLLACGGLAGWYEWNIHAATEKGVVMQVQHEKETAAKQKEIDDAKLEKAHSQLAVDAGKIARYNFDAGASSIVCRRPAPQLPTPELSPPRAAPTGVVAVSDELHTDRPDIRGALEVYARRAAELAAEYHELDSATH